MATYVNAETGFVYAPTRGMSGKNCAVCTAAGAVNLSGGSSVVTTSDVIKECKVVNVKQLGDDSKVQLESIKKYVAKMTKRKPDVLEGGKEVALGKANGWMKKKREKTVFAVLADGFLIEGDGKPRCHWLNAILAGGTIRYFDFQTMRKGKYHDFVGAANPSTSRKPFVGVYTQQNLESGSSHRVLHSSQQAGVFKDDVKLTVVAFEPRH